MTRDQKAASLSFMGASRSGSQPLVTHGGSRSGSGRKRRSLRTPHLTRELVHEKSGALMIVTQLRQNLKLHSPRVIQCFHQALRHCNRRGLRVLHYRLGSTTLSGVRSLRRNSREIQLICEVKNRKTLERATKSLLTRLAIAIKRDQVSKHKGPVFLDRFKSWALRGKNQTHWAAQWMSEADSDFSSLPPHESLGCVSARSFIGRQLDRLLC
jgi:hypothetical protein